MDYFTAQVCIRGTRELSALEEGMICGAIVSSGVDSRVESHTEAYRDMWDNYHEAAKS